MQRHSRLKFIVMLEITGKGCSKYPDERNPSTAGQAPFFNGLLEILGNKPDYAGGIQKHNKERNRCYIFNQHVPDIVKMKGVLNVLDFGLLLAMGQHPTGEYSNAKPSQRQQDIAGEPVEQDRRYFSRP